MNNETYYIYDHEKDRIVGHFEWTSEGLTIVSRDHKLKMFIEHFRNEGIGFICGGGYKNGVHWDCADTWRLEQFTKGEEAKGLIGGAKTHLFQCLNDKGYSTCGEMTLDMPVKKKCVGTIPPVLWDRYEKCKGCMDTHLCLFKRDIDRYRREVEKYNGKWLILKYANGNKRAELNIDEFHITVAEKLRDIVKVNDKVFIFDDFTTPDIKKKLSISFENDSSVDLGYVPEKYVKNILEFMHDGNRISATIANIKFPKIKVSIKHDGFCF